uniref:E3 ubiquitin-protein ligase RNF180-like isoform X1 n=2 Tax=Myxine glutinosa TaxID=7769 RepID=UPI00358F2726
MSDVRLKTEAVELGRRSAVDASGHSDQLSPIESLPQDSANDAESGDASMTNKKKSKCWRWFSKWRKSRGAQKVVDDDAKDSPVTTDKVEPNTIQKENEHLEYLTCPICLDIAVGPHKYLPCHHVYCVSCLRRVRRRHTGQVHCALCRSPVTHEIFCRDLDIEARKAFPGEYFPQYLRVKESTPHLGGGFMHDLKTRRAYRQWNAAKVCVE